MSMISWLAFLLLTPSDSTGCKHPATSQLQTVCPYLAALQTMDPAGMVKYWAPGVVFLRQDGTSRTIDPGSMARVREFELAMHTRWGYTVDSVRGDTVLVSETEASDFYDLLGLGERDQTGLYVVQGGLITAMAVRGLRHARGDYRSTYAAFLDWLLRNDGVGDSTLVSGGDLVFDGASAEPMRRWLIAWRDAGRPHRSQ